MEKLNTKKTEILGVIPVFESANIERDVAWYKEKAGFETLFSEDGYAVIYRENIYIHLQWHAGTEEDPLNGGAVIRVIVKNILPLFEDFVERGTVSKDNLKMKTAWNTNEFGFYDLNKNAVFIMENIE